MLTRNIHCGAPSGRFRRSYAPTCRLRTLGAQIEGLADIGAHRNSPRVGSVGGPIEGHLRIDVCVPSANEVVADHRFDVGLILTLPRARVPANDIRWYASMALSHGPSE